MFKRLKKKTEAELSVLEACEKYCKKFLDDRRFKVLLDGAKRVDDCKNKKQKQYQLKELSKEVSKIYNHLNKIIEYGKYAIELSTGAPIMRKMYYKSKLKFTEDECNALSEFWRYLIITENRIDRDINANKDLKD